jgi:CheY-like chemotaxis protein
MRRFRELTNVTRPGDATVRILLVEDDHMIGAGVAPTLKDAAYTTDWVADGELALDAALRSYYDLVILDLGLPSRDGLSVLRELRRHQHGLPVIILTARDGIVEKVDGLDLGAEIADTMGKSVGTARGWIVEGIRAIPFENASELLRVEMLRLKP